MDESTKQDIVRDIDKTLIVCQCLLLNSDGRRKSGGLSVEDECAIDIIRRRTSNFMEGLKRDKNSILGQRSKRLVMGDSMDNAFAAKETKK